MTNEQINIAIAEACGWQVNKHKYLAKPPNGDWQYKDKIPDYCNDLNAMHGAEKQMRSGDWTRYCQYLAEYGGGTVRFVSVHASAWNRAKAFLKTLEKWEE
jgi:hypothetical protein